MKLIYIIPLLFFCALLGCKKEIPSSHDTYIGGLIMNPTSKFVVLLKQDVVVDTFYLNDKNQFGGPLVDAEKGIYVFKHPPENQLMYLEPGDSTLIFLNTLAFDESLTFSGRGAEKSNYLNDMYLLNQKNNQFILSYYELDPTEFAAKTDSIREGRIKELKRLNKKKKFSKDFYSLANSSINYEYYDLRERYAYLIRRYSKEYIDKIPSDFHDYRKDISFNDEQLQDNYVYLNLIDDYLRTRSLELCDVSGTENKGCLNLTNYDNILSRIHLADSLIDNPRVKNTFINRLAAQGIIYSKTSEEITGIMDLLKQIEYSGDRMADLQQLGELQNSLFPGNKLGEVQLIKTNRDSIEINSISAKPKITYHWSVISNRHHRWQHKIIEDLRVKYPEIDFIGINIDRDRFNDWTRVIKKEKYNEKFEFKINPVNINEALLKNYLNKLMFLDPSGTIVRANVQLNSLDHETSILEFLSSPD